MTHTPGPWIIHPAYKSSVAVSYRDGYRIICHLERFDDTWADTARLIAAAPDLYEYVKSSASGGCATAKLLVEQIDGHS